MKTNCLVDNLQWRTGGKDFTLDVTREDVIISIIKIMTNTNVNFYSVIGFETGVSVDDFLNEI